MGTWNEFDLYSGFNFFRKCPVEDNMKEIVELARKQMIYWFSAKSTKVYLMRRKIYTLCDAFGI